MVQQANTRSFDCVDRTASGPIHFAQDDRAWVIQVAPGQQSGFKNWVTKSLCLPEREDFLQCCHTDGEEFWPFWGKKNEEIIGDFVLAGGNSAGAGAVGAFTERPAAL